MEKLLIATHNLHKLNEFKQLLKGIKYQIVSLSDLGIKVEVNEDQDSYQANALIKAKYYAKMTSLLTISDDSGIEIEALNFLPGIYSARFLGKATSYEDKNKIILAKVKENRKAYFICAICLAKPDNEPTIVEARVSGKIVKEIKGQQGFGYDPIFIPDGHELSYGEMSQEEKNKSSHRAKAVAMIRHLLE